MAGFGWSMRPGNMHEHNHPRKRPYATAQIACRICDQVFLSTQALINHIETHMIEDGSVDLRRQHEMNLMLSQRDHSANPLQHNVSSLPPPMRPPNQSGNVSQVSQARNNFFGATARVVAPPLRLSSLGREHFELGPHPPTKSSQYGQQRLSRKMEEPHSDCTKPFIDRLQHTIPDVVKQVENEDGNNEMNDSETLDLTLKL